MARKNEMLGAHMGNIVSGWEGKKRGWGGGIVRR
jgi:hypothetical protein